MKGRIAIVTDAWLPQVNGVSNVFYKMYRELTALGYDVLVVNHSLFSSIQLPLYKEIRLSIDVWRMERILDEFNPQYIHIVTEAPLGLYARHYCVKRNLPFSTSYHTRFPEYFKKYIHLPLKYGYEYQRWFHKPSSVVMATAPHIVDELREYGLHDNIIVWYKGVDTELFHPNLRQDELIIGGVTMKRPVHLFVGRVSVEKNVEFFLDLPIKSGSKLIVGDGPLLGKFTQKYSKNNGYDDILFCGYKFGRNLAEIYASADVFVFPSKTDTFGLVNLEASACGTPCVAFDVTGPRDSIANGVTGILCKDESEFLDGINKALQLDRNTIREYIANKWSWRSSALFFLEHLIDIHN